jgi:hypothetical protein
VPLQMDALAPVQVNHRATTARKGGRLGFRCQLSPPGDQLVRYRLPEIAGVGGVVSPLLRSRICSTPFCRNAIRLRSGETGPSLSTAATPFWVSCVHRPLPIAHHAVGRLPASVEEAGSPDHPLPSPATPSPPQAWVGQRHVSHRLADQIQALESVCFEARYW